MTSPSANQASPPAPPAGLRREQLLELYYWMRLTRTLEERLVALYRQTKVVGGLFRSLGQEADAVGSAYALDRAKGDVLSPLIRNLGSMLVRGATPLEVLRQYMARADGPTRGRELNIHFGGPERGFIGQISHLGDMVPVMAGVGGRAWPGDAAARANARSVSAEMHSGFAALRTAWSMRAAVRGLDVPPGPAAVADIARIDEIWSECRARHASGGPWLFGRYGIADAMYAPVVLRFDTYGARLSDAARDYFATVLADPHLREWVRGAEREVAAEGRPLAHP